MLLNGVRVMADLLLQTERIKKKTKKLIIFRANLGVLKSLKAARLARGLSMDPERPRELDDEAPEAGLGSLDIRLAEVGPLVEEFVLWARSPVFRVPMDLLLFILKVQIF